MNAGRRAAAFLLCGALAVLASRTAGAQSIALTITPLSPLRTDSLSPAPTIAVAATPVPDPFAPSHIQLEISRDPQFLTTIFSRSAASLDTQFTVDSLLPEKTRIYFRARLFDRFGTRRAEATVSRVVRSWLALTFPANGSNVIFTRRPTFTWDSPPITLPPSPWQYVFRIFSTATGEIEEQRGTDGSLRQTSIVPLRDLDACTSYRWSVTARAANGGPNDVVTVQSAGTFVIQSPECPSATLSYQNFPNPFGRGTTSDKTCFWFDLAHRTTVRLAIYDVRLHEVKQLVPGALPAQLDSGAYGRQAGEITGCAPELLWDGTDDRGRKVPQGVYIAVFEADGRRETKKLFYKGP